MYQSTARTQLHETQMVNLPVATAERRLRLLSYNIQAGIPAENWRRYITGGWRHVLPDMERCQNLDLIAAVVKEFDVVALQEVDTGSLRSGFVNQVKYLAERGQFPHWYYQLNRNLGRLGQHSNGFLSRIAPDFVCNHKLPGMIPGRGAIMARFDMQGEPLVLVTIHLALGKRARNMQLSYIAELIEDYKHVIVMGDMNCSCQRLMAHSPLRDTSLLPVTSSLRTFPSWRPRRDLDHILVSPGLNVHAVEVFQRPYSDHLPLAIEIELPAPIKA